MISKRHLKKSIDLFMFGLMLFLLSYAQTRGLYRHAVCGLIILGLFCLHHFLNRRWYAALLKGQWKTKRVFTTVTDILLLITTCALVTSCALMSGEVFAFAPFPMIWWARNLHVASSAWLFLLIALHTGCHWQGLWLFLRRITGKTAVPAAVLLLAAGFYYVAQSGMWSSLTAGYGHSEIENLEQFLIQYLLIALAFYLLPNLIFTCLAHQLQGRLP